MAAAAAQSSLSHLHSRSIGPKHAENSNFGKSEARNDDDEHEDDEEEASAEGNKNAHSYSHRYRVADYLTNKHYQ